MWLWALAGWTSFVWATRISNILDDGGGAGALAVAVALTVLGLSVAAHALTARLPWAPPALVLATVVVWAVRVPTMLLADHPLGFDLVHVALAAVSLGLAAVVWGRHDEVARRGRALLGR